MFGFALERFGTANGSRATIWRRERVCVSARQEDTSLEGGEPKTWLEFARDIRLSAPKKQGGLCVNSLGSCASRGFLDPLVTLDWKVKRRRAGLRV